MSVDIWVVAHRKLTQDNLALVRLYNDLVDRNFTPPAEIVRHLKGLFGEDSFWPGEPIVIPADTDTVEVRVKSKGDVMYGEGQIIKIADLPPGTIELRVYAEA